jgi:hypothetical protein
MVDRPPGARVSSAIVELGGSTFVCFWIDAGDGPVLKCGRCGRGNLIAKKGQRCAVCTAALVSVPT